jgi:myo-inositol-1-phosphate synthase
LADLFRDRIDKVLPHLNDLNKAKGLQPIAPKNIYVGPNAYLELLKDDKVDAVVIATPAYAHPFIFEAAVKAHKHVYCEKPAAPDAYGAVRMMKAAEGIKDLSLVMGFQVRYSSAYAEMIRRIHNGDIGEVLTAQLYYNGNGGACPKPEREDDEFYMEDLIGFAVTAGKLHGEITDYYDSEANPLFGITFDGREECLVPAAEEFIAAIDFDKRKIKLVLPEGLLEL